MTTTRPNLATMVWVSAISWMAIVGSTAGQVPPTASVESVTAQVNDLFEQRWRADHVLVNELTDDATFMRRASLDLTGNIPTVGEVRAFLDDPRPDKRHRLIESLLSRPRHASHLAQVWRELLLPKESDATPAAAFEAWLQQRFQRRLPYDQLVREILTARGTSLQSEPTIFFAANGTKPEELAAGSSRAFLGLQVRCAQCHDHPFAPWKQNDFWQLAAFFARVQGPANLGQQTSVADLDVGEVTHPKTQQSVAPAFLDGRPYVAAADVTRRAALAQWVTAPENPYFARAAVNRLWWIAFARGLVQPVDDLGSHTTATHPEVLDLLAADFVAGGFDVRRTLRIIFTSKPYQLASSPNVVDRHWESNYSSMPIRSLSARQVYDALLQAAGQRGQTAESQRERRQFLARFEAPNRDALEYQGGIPQVLMLLNGPLVARLTDPATGDLIAALADSPFLNDSQRIEAVFLATVSRPPRPAELERTQRVFEGRSTNEARAQALGDILWALLNSSEFVLNR